MSNLSGTVHERGLWNMRIAVIGILLIGLTACSQNLDNATDEEVLIASCMDDSYMSKQSLKLFGPTNKEWCNCQLGVIQETVSPEIYKQIASVIRKGESPHFMHASTLIGDHENDQANKEAVAAMEAWRPVCKPLR